MSVSVDTKLLLTKWQFSASEIKKNSAPRACQLLVIVRDTATLECIFDRCQHREGLLNGLLCQTISLPLMICSMNRFDLL